MSTGGRLIVSGVVQFPLPKIRYFAIEHILYWHPRSNFFGLAREFLMRDQGILDEGEFQSAKQALLRKLQTLGREYGRGGGGA